MKPWLKCLAMAILAAGMVPLSAGARQTCGELVKDMDYYQKEADLIVEEMRPDVTRLDQIKGYLAGIQGQRQQFGCGGRVLDRAVLAQCQQFDRDYAAWNDSFNTLKAKVDAWWFQRNDLLYKRHQVETNFQVKCTCWTGGRAHTGMAGRNLYGFQAQNLDDCKTRCLMHDKCRSIDYDAKKRTCYLNYLDSRSRGPSPTFTSTPTWPYTYYELCHG